MRHATMSPWVALALSATVILVSGCGHPAECGNGAIESGEACDDGNTLDADGCSAVCQPEVSGCGDGVVDSGETCDDGNAMDGDGCSAICAIEPVCGDAVVEGSEACDDGNNADGDGCSAVCQLEPAACGDWLLQIEIGEECEPPNTATCDSNCLSLAPCPPISMMSVGCGVTFMGDTTAGTADADTWECLDGYWMTGPELMYELTLVADQLVTVTMTPADSGLALMAMPDDAGGCSRDLCTPSQVSFTSWDTEDQVVQFVGYGGETHFIIVETFAHGVGNAGGLGAPFMLTVACSDPPVCGDGALDDTEQCDDGNVVAGDGCDPECGFEGAVCGVESPIFCDQMITAHTGSGVQSVDAYVCYSSKWGIPTVPGPELSYVFVPTVSETVTIRLDGLSNNQDLFVLPDSTAGCLLSSCLFSANGGTAPSYVTTPVTAGLPTYIVVDGYTGLGGPFTLEVDCPSVTCGDGIVAGPETCDDGNLTIFDGCDASCQCEPTVHGDGVIQCTELCDDGNTVGGDGCSATGQLECGPWPAPPIDCATSGLPGTTVGGSTDAMAYACVPGLSYPDPETTFEFVAPAGGAVRFDLSGLSADLDLFVLPANASTCTDCDFSAAGFNRLTAPESVQIVAEAGRTYHVIVESFGNPGGAFTLDVTCLCGNGVLDTGETCDDGGTIPGDGCDASCQIE